ncbi:MAG TPA: CAP domain-containing protein [Candidatus Paceibacterota bacterium]|nr:CAP domain-containing protein [Candidatus Paceibacterota bacterium]
MVRDLLLIALAVGVLAAGTLIEAPASPEPAQPVELGASVRAASVFSLSNEERKAEGVAQLSLNPLIMRAAQLKAEDMAEEAYYAHVSPDGETPMHWLDQVGYKYQYVGENLTANIMDEESVVSAWMGSPGHRRNLLDPKFSHMGIGVAEGTYKGKPALFVVQMLATPKPVAVPAAPKPVTVASKPVTPVKTPPAKPIATPTPLAPKPITENKVVAEVKELTKPIVEPLLATSTVRLFSASSTDPIPLVISTSAIPVELRTGTTADTQVAAPEEMREIGREVSVRWHQQVTGFMRGVIDQVSALLGS